METPAEKRILEQIQEIKPCNVSKLTHKELYGALDNILDNVDQINSLPFVVQHSGGVKVTSGDMVFCTSLSNWYDMALEEGIEWRTEKGQFIRIKKHQVYDIRYLEVRNSYRGPVMLMHLGNVFGFPEQQEVLDPNESVGQPIEMSVGLRDIKTTSLKEYESKIKSNLQR